MDWFETIMNTVLFVGVIAGIVVERKSSKQINKRLDAQAKQIGLAVASANSAKVSATAANKAAAEAKHEVLTITADKQIIVPALPDTPHNKDVVERLRQAAVRVSAKRAHPAGRGRNRINNYGTVSNPMPGDNTALNAAVFATIATASVDTSSHSSYSDSSSSSSSSYDSGSSSSSSDSGSFGGGDSGSF